MQYFKALKNPSFYRAFTRETHYTFSTENKLAEELANQLHNLKTAKTPGAITNVFSKSIPIPSL